MNLKPDKLLQENLNLFQCPMSQNKENGFLCLKLMYIPEYCYWLLYYSPRQIIVSNRIRLQVNSKRQFCDLEAWKIWQGNLNL